MPTNSDPFERIYSEIRPNPGERLRYTVLRTSLAAWGSFYAGKEVLDFGASDGLSIAALLYNGARYVVGVEPDRTRVGRGLDHLAEAGLDDRSMLEHVADTRHLDFADGRFECILLNAVVEHIPQPRDEYLREIWRVLSPGGHLIVNETPNKYYPKEVHTTGLWFNHWLPRDVAHRRAVRSGRFNPAKTNWPSSGWRGLGYFELVRSITGYRLIPESSHRRHRFLKALGIPASIIDPYPCWVLEKL